MECIVNLNLSEYLLLFQFLGVYLGVEFQTHPIMNIKRNIIFALESRKKNGVPIVENVPIRMRVIYASQRIEFTTGYRIDVAKWDADKQRVKNGCTNKLKQSASEINADLLKYYAEIQNVFKEFEVQETMPTTQQLKDAFNLRMKDTNEAEQRKACYVFEGFMDYLSFLTLRLESCPQYPDLDKQDYMVLNSVTNVNKALYPLGSYERIHCFFDNDRAGMEALRQIRMEYDRDLYIRDASQTYSGCKDLNEYLQKQAGKNKQVQSVKEKRNVPAKKPGGFRL